MRGEREGGRQRTKNPTNGHALDPVVEVAHVEYTTLGAFFEARFLQLVIMFGHCFCQIGSLQQHRGHLIK